jgi:hypothetical protein
VKNRGPKGLLTHGADLPDDAEEFTFEDEGGRAAVEAARKHAKLHPKQWNPRYVAWLHTLPGAEPIPPTWEFSAWIQERISRFRTVRPEAFMVDPPGREPVRLVDHDAFDRFLGVVK